MGSFKRRVGKPQKHTKKNSTSFKKGIDKPVGRCYNKDVNKKSNVFHVLLLSKECVRFLAYALLFLAARARSLRAEFSQFSDNSEFIFVKKFLKKCLTKSRNCGILYSRKRGTHYDEFKIDILCITLHL